MPAGVEGEQDAAAADSPPETPQVSRPSGISAWLGAVVVQVIAVGLVIARSLFPPEKKSV